jgi:branched-subunit amino acid transport protein AzlD
MLYLDIIFKKYTIMTAGIILILVIVILTRIYKIRKNGGVTDIATEVYEAGLHFILSLINFAIITA